MNTEIIIIILSLILAYLIGSFPSAYVIAKLRKGVDIRKIGSHNMGAMNTFYKIGFWWGMLVLVMDIGKGLLAVAEARWLGTHLYVQLAAGLAVILGHSFPLFLKFKGGKGGASCIGVLIMFMPWGAPIYLALFGIFLAITRYPTFSYSIAFLCFPVLAVTRYHSQWVPFLVFSAVLLIIPFARYIPRMKEMHTGSGGSWKHVAMRKSLKDRL